MKPKVYGDRLATIYEARQIKTQHLHRLASVDTRAKKAVFHLLPEPKTTPLMPDHGLERVVVDFDFLHFVPPQAASDFVRYSPLTTEEDRPKGGWVTVDKHTLIRLVSRICG